MSDVVLFILSGLLIALAGISKAVQDKTSFHFERSIFFHKSDFWNPEKSWKFKWKNGDPKQGERFPLSTTLLVSLTDAWHLFGTIRNFSIFLGALLLPMNWISLLGYPLFFITFHIFYTYIFKKRTDN